LIDTRLSRILDARYRPGDDLVAPTVSAVLEMEAAEMLPGDTAGMRHAVAPPRPGNAVVITGLGTVAQRTMTAPGLAAAFKRSGVRFRLAAAHSAVDDLLADSQWDLAMGFSPYKAELATRIAMLSISARQTRSVDTAVRSGGQLIGLNLNSWTMQAVLEGVCGARAPRRVLLLGGGSSARSVALAVRRAWGAEVRLEVWARRAAASAALAEHFGCAVVGSPGAAAAGVADSAAEPLPVVVNCTSWGETAQSECEPFGVQVDHLFSPGGVFLDLNNRVSWLQQQALTSGCQVTSGVMMRDLNHVCRAALAGRLR
jgi:shikimate dehydrogenase